MGSLVASALRMVERAISNAQLQRLDYSKVLQLCVFSTRSLPTAALWQDGPVLWIHPIASPAERILWYPAAIADLALRGLKASLEYLGCQPNELIIPYTTQQIQTLAATSDEWDILVTGFSGKITI